VDIDPVTSSLTRGQSPPAQQIVNSAGQASYMGPCPPYMGPCPPLGVHHYRITVYALSRRLSLPPPRIVDERTRRNPWSGHRTGKARRHVRALIATIPAGRGRAVGSDRGRLAAAGWKADGQARTGRHDHGHAQAQQHDTNADDYVAEGQTFDDPRLRRLGSPDRRSASTACSSERVIGS
jgi:Phosphatidylethanolamine-binding protein